MSQIMVWEGTSPGDEDDAQKRIQGMRFLGQALRAAIENLSAVECDSSNPTVHAAVFEEAVKEVIGDGRFSVRFIDPAGNSGPVTIDRSGSLEYNDGTGPKNIAIKYELDQATSGVQRMTIGGSSVCRLIEAGAGDYIGKLCEEFGLDPTLTNNRNLVLACVSFRRCR